MSKSKAQISRCNKLLIICGPTATGKTALAAALARKFDGELVSADSRQVYRGMDIVTGKDRPQVPIWLYDVVDPDDEFSVSQWVDLARSAIVDICGRNKLAIVVGGTGLYIHALLHPLETISVPPDKRLREKLQKVSVGELQSMIPRGTMNQSDWGNPRRLIRKIEIARSKSRPQKQTHQYDSLVIGLTAQNSILDKRIDKRRSERKRQGMEREAASLLARYEPNLPSMSAIAVNEHAYARRQMTWFKKQPSIHWFDITKPSYARSVTQLVTRWYT
jgi:tRNA dimethylallyltransferase